MLSWTAFTALATIALVAAELVHVPWAYRLCKVLASTGFVGLAVAAGAFAHAYGVTMLVGLALAWVGDVCLLARGSRRAFVAGLGAFALAHVAYAVGFAQLGPRWPIAGLAAAGLALPAWRVLRWLAPHVPARLRVPVRSYVVIISAMLAMAVGGFAGDARLLVLAGAFGFYLSDLFVARERFVRPGPLNRLCGLPLYYGAQICLAWSTCP
jgi:uncharacterized membrane protein YhhN